MIVLLEKLNFYPQLKITKINVSEFLRLNIISSFNEGRGEVQGKVVCY